MTKTFYKKTPLGKPPFFCDPRGDYPYCCYCGGPVLNKQGERNFCSLPKSFLFSNVNGDVAVIHPMIGGSQDPYEYLFLCNKIDKARGWILIPPGEPFKRHICWRVRWIEAGGVKMSADFHTWEHAAKRWITETLEHGKASLTRVVKTFGKSSYEDFPKT